MSQTTPTGVKYYRSARTITGWTIVVLVLLRVAVGWHFFYEGWWKLTSGGKFSSTPYLMAATGPLEDVFHWMVDDMDGTKKRMTKEFLCAALDKRYETILKHYGADSPDGIQKKKEVDDIQKAVNGGLTDLQLNTMSKEAELLSDKVKDLTAKQEALAKDSKPLSPDDAKELARCTARLKSRMDQLEAAERKVNDGLTKQEYNGLVAKQVAGKLTAAEKVTLERANRSRDAHRPTPNQDALLKAELPKLTQAQVDSLKAFVERKKHGIKDDLTVAKLFDNDDLFEEQVRYAGEYADPKNVDKTDRPTVVWRVPIPEKKDAIIAGIQAILDDLDKTVPAAVDDAVLSDDQTDADRLAQKEKQALVKSLPPVKIEPDGATDLTWLTPGYVEGLVRSRYALLEKTCELTDRQKASRYGSRYCDQKIRGHHDKNNVDAIIDDPDFKNDLDGYEALLKQIEKRGEQINTQFDDQRQVFDNGKKKDGLRNKLLARVEAPMGDIDLQKMQGFGEYIGPIKEMSQAQFSVGPVPVSPRELEFPGNLLKKAGLDVPKKTLTYWQDLGMMIGLTVIGACLILGLFTRLAALGGAVMLLMFYLAMPPFPGAHVPENAAEGHYLFVNKNLIEMLVMLVFATSGIGRWFGLDSILHAIFGRRVAVEPTEPAPAESVQAQPAGGPVFVNPSTRAFPAERGGNRP